MLHRHIDADVIVSEVRSFSRALFLSHAHTHSSNHSLLSRPRVCPSTRSRHLVQVRETSRKPDEIYKMIERLSPHTRKLEIFGRQHNTRPQWFTLGNQLNGQRILEPDVAAKYKAAFPDKPFITY